MNIDADLSTQVHQLESLLYNTGGSGSVLTALCQSNDYNDESKETDGDERLKLCLDIRSIDIHIYCQSITHMIKVIPIWVMINHTTGVLYRLEFIDFKEIIEEVIDTTDLEAECSDYPLITLGEDLLQAIEPG